MPHSRERFDSEVQLTPDMSCSPRQFDPASELKMLVPRTNASALKIIHTSAVKLIKPYNKPTPYQSAAFYLSILTTFFPGLLPLAKESLLESGYTVREVTEDTASENNITLEPCIDVSTALAIFSLFTLIIYKDVDYRSQQRYDQSIQSWAAEVKTVAGVVGYLVPGVGDVMLSLYTAKDIRTIVGGCSRIRAGLLKVVLANQDGHSRLNRVCKYLAGSISWTDMEPVMYMFESLYLANSPVLKDTRIKHEVRNMHEAYERVMEKQYPQYYAILHPTEAGVTIAKSRFETLAEVASRYESEQNKTVRQYASTRNNTLVNNLLAVHRAYMASTNPSV